MTESTPAPKKRVKKASVKKTANVEVIPSLGKPSGFVITGTTYDFLKRFAQIVLPALGAFYFALAQIWGLPGAEQVIGTIAAINTFVGAAVLVSKNNYVKSGAAFGGTINIEQGESAKMFSLELNDDPEALENKSSVTFKVDKSKL